MIQALRRARQGVAYIHPLRRENWDGSESYRPARVLHPTSTDEVANMVRVARGEGRQLFPIGSLHSWSLRTAEDCDFDFVDLSAMSSVLSIDTENEIVEAQAGAKIRDVNERLLRLEVPLTLQGIGSVQEQSLAGAVSNATNPHSGGRLASIACYQTEIEIVDGLGRVHVLTDADGDLMRAARVSLGLLGIVTRVKLKVAPAWVAVRQFRDLDAQDVVPSVDAALHAEDYTTSEFVYYPEPRHFATTTTRPATPEEQDGIDLEALKDHEAKCPVAGYAVLTPLMNLSPRFARLWQKRLAFPVGHRLYSARDQTRWSTHIFQNDEAIFSMAEYYVPRSRLAELLDEIPRFYHRLDDPYVHPWLKFRPQKQVHNAWMCPAYGRDSVTVMVSSCPLKKKYFAGFRAWEELFLSLEARPHWGTWHSSLSRSVMNALYGEAFERFVEVRRDLDPECLLLREPDKAAFK